LLSAWILPRNVNKNVLNGALHLSSTFILEHSEWEIGNYYRFCRNQNSLMGDLADDGGGRISNTFSIDSGYLTCLLPSL
jgi:hypothetical protein